MHGDETIGREILISLIYHLLSNYGTDENITNLINTTNIFIMPSGASLKIFLQFLIFLYLFSIFSFNNLA